MNLHKNHRERLKERFLKEGLRSFAHHNKLELLLFYSIPRRDTNEIAHKLLNHFGGLVSIFDATFDELLKVEGIGEHTALLIKLVPQLAAAYLDDQLEENMMLNSLEKVGEYLIPKFIDKVNEIVIIVNLNPQKRVISWEIVQEGSITTVKVPTRKIVESVLRTQAHSIILAHNHPGGIPMPSRGDILASIQIGKILRSIDVEITDNIIVSGREYVSIKESENYFKDIKTDQF